MSHYIIIHGHFYQPPRENPWLEAIEVQDSAYPYHDWNQRVTAESYRPNATSRILGANGRIEEIVNNYARMSFNFGPTLLVWLEEHAPDVYQAILDADKESAERFGGHGSAVAQAYNHIILPLANRRDKQTQVIWGIEDFRRRFGRNPEGMWLPETAVDTESLEVLAEQGIKFTILAPRQAKRVRELHDGSPKGEWIDVSGERIDTRKAYRVSLPSGKHLAIFFYNGGLAKAVAFEGLLKDGAKFADYLLSGINRSDPSPQLSHIATDGETYGHHHRFGDMALAFALRRIEKDSVVKLTNYGQFLEMHPPICEVEIIENASWSCAHGVERWRSDCGCATGEHPGWRQVWRWPLRQALDWLRDDANSKYEARAANLLIEPWGARDRYIRLVLDRNPDNVEEFFRKEAKGGLTVKEKAEVLMLLEMQRHLMLMFTSCGWFFDDVAGIETTQDLAYAGRAMQLAQILFGDHIEARFLGMLEQSGGNKPELSTARAVYESLVRPTIVDPKKLCAHYALTGLFEVQPERASIYQYEVRQIAGRTYEAGRARLSVGRVEVRSRVTYQTAEMFFAAIHLGDHNVTCGVSDWEGEDAYRSACADLAAAFGRADMPGVIRSLDRRFDGNIFGLRSIFKDGQRKLLKRILKQTLMDVEGLYRDIYEDHTPLMRYLSDMRAPVPHAFITATEFIINGDLRKAVKEEDLDIGRIERMLEEAAEWGVGLDLEGLKYRLTQNIDQLAANFTATPTEGGTLAKLMKAVRLAEETVLDANLWNAQNACYAIAKRRFPELAAKAQSGDPDAEDWVWEFRKLTDLLKVAV